MRVVLREGADAHEAVERARALVAVDEAELADAHRQLAVAVDVALVDEDAAGAVHRLNRERLAVYLGEVHVLLVVVPVAGTQPERAVQDHRRLYLDVAALCVLLAPEGLERVEDDHALRMEEGEAGAFGMDAEKVQLLAELAVVARLRLFEALEVSLELVLAAEGGAVDARQHLVVLVAVPVRAREREKLEELAAAGVRDVRAAAEVGEVALGVGRERLALYAFDELDLEVLAHRRELLDRLVLRQLAAHERNFLLRYAAHLGLNLRQVVVGNRLREADVVVESVLYRGADAELGLGPEAQNGVGEKMRR